MNEQQSHSVDVLNELYEAEMHTLLPRLLDLSLTVSRQHPVYGALLRRIAQESREHREWLIEEIESGRGSVRPATLDIHSASLHYTSAAAVLPQVQRNLQELIAAYAQAAGRSPLTSSALALIRRIARRYEAALESLREAASPRVVPAQK